MLLPAPVIENVDGFQIVRDDLLPGGTKRRAIPALFQPGFFEYVYASPVYGYAQIALAHAAADNGFRSHIFCAKRHTRHPRTALAEAAGARITEVPYGYMNVVKARAREYAERHVTTRVLPFGFDDPLFVEALAAVAKALPVTPSEVWTAAGSGTLTRALQIAWPLARFCAVRVGAVPNVGRALLYEAPEAYERAAAIPPPFPSCSNYDAKVWRFMKKDASPGALFWNVGA